MSLPLLVTKLHVPFTRPARVARPRLVARLNEPRPLTLIAAPAGFGKTTLVAEWLGDLRQTPTAPRAAWLSLDEADNDPVRFLTYLLAAVQTGVPEIGAGALALLQAPQPPLATLVLTTLLNELAQRPEAGWLVLDDYHVIQTPELHAVVAFLGDYLPPAWHLILTTRADPPLPLARWRVRDRLTEIRADELRFTRAEAAGFLNQVMGLTLSVSDIAALETRTEGWVAGLQLAALSMQGRADPSGFVQAFTNSPVFVVDYLAEEVLRRESLETQAFLLQTAVLDRLCGELCDALTGGQDGAATLERLRQRNFFLTALDDERRWYRYHHLFADVLRAHLRQAGAYDVAGLHRRASTWLGAHGLVEEAIGHSLAARDFAASARLIEDHRIALANSGQAATLARWLAALPAELRRTRPGLSLAEAWVAGPLGDYAAIPALLADAEAALASWPAAEAGPLRGEITATRAMLSSFLEDPRALELARQALAELPAEAGPLRFIVTAGLCFSYFRAGQLAEAEQQLRQFHATVDPRALINGLGVTAMLAMVKRLQGRLRAAHQFSREAMRLAEVNGQPLLDAGTILAYAVLSRVEYERHQLTEAEAHLRQCAELAGEARNLGTHLYALTELAQIALTRRDLEQARDWLAQAEALTAGQPLLPTNALTYGAMRARLWLAEGDAPAAEAWARRQPRLADAPRLSPYDFQRLILVEAHLAQRHWAAALANLDELTADAEATGQEDVRLRALILRAEAQQQAGQTAAARLSLQAALGLAEPEGYITVFLERGPAVQALLAILAAETGRNGRNDPYFQALLKSLPPPETRPTAALAAAQLLEPLSERELEVLRLVAQGLSDRQIAERLVVVVGTVKRHLSNLYGKLGVRSRTQALARAHELGLLAL